jgi:hypothetical protein
MITLPGRLVVCSALDAAWSLNPLLLIDMQAAKTLLCGMLSCKQYLVCLTASACCMLLCCSLWLPCGPDHVCD